jgi:hypothetical protein
MEWPRRIELSGAVQHSLFSAKVIQVTQYREEYEALRRIFTDAGLPPYQEITDQRNY